MSSYTSCSYYPTTPDYWEDDNVVITGHSNALKALKALTENDKVELKKKMLENAEKDKTTEDLKKVEGKLNWVEKKESSDDEKKPELEEDQEFPALGAQPKVQPKKAKMAKFVKKLSVSVPIEPAASSESGPVWETKGGRGERKSAAFKPAAPLAFSSFCFSVLAGETKRCPHKECRFAHKFVQWNPSSCVFDLNCKKHGCTFKHSNETNEQYMARRQIKLKEAALAAETEAKTEAKTAPRFFAPAPEKMERKWAAVAAPVETPTSEKVEKPQPKAAKKRWDVKPDEIEPKEEPKEEPKVETKTVTIRLPKDIDTSVISKMVAAVDSSRIVIEFY